MRNFVVVGAAALTLALGVAQAFASGPVQPQPNIYDPSWQSQNTSAPAIVRGR
jgi:hypothetical protein